MQRGSHQGIETRFQLSQLSKNILAILGAKSVLKWVNESDDNYKAPGNMQKTCAVDLNADCICAPLSSKTVPHPSGGCKKVQYKTHCPHRETFHSSQ